MNNYGLNGRTVRLPDTVLEPVGKVLVEKLVKRLWGDSIEQALYGRGVGAR